MNIDKHFRLDLLNLICCSKITKSTGIMMKYNRTAERVKHCIQKVLCSNPDQVPTSCLYCVFVILLSHSGIASRSNPWLCCYLIFKSAYLNQITRFLPVIFVPTQDISVLKKVYQICSFLCVDISNDAGSCQSWWFLICFLQLLAVLYNLKLVSARY